jgi:ribokinase
MAAMSEDRRHRRGSVVVVGSANLDLVVSVEALPLPGETVLARGSSRGCGGKGANQAAAAGRLGARTRLVAATGDDDGGDTVRRAAEAAGVATDHVQSRFDVPTGLAVITVDRHGENVIVVAPGANAELTEDAAMAGLDGVGPGDVAVVSLEIPLATAEAALRTARQRGATAILNPSPYAPSVPTLLPWVDVLIMNEGEAERLADHLDRDLAAVITMGAAGARVRLSADTEGVSVAAPVVDVVDTTGCGDAFAGAVAAELADGADLISATRLAVRYAALAATRSGAQASYVDRRALAAGGLE